MDRIFSSINGLLRTPKRSRCCSFCSTKFKLYQGFKIGEGWTEGWSEAKFMCQDCLADRLGVRVLASNIVPGEHGLFAAKSFNRGDFIVPWCGVKRSAHQILKEYKQYSTQYGVTIDGDDNVDSPHPMNHGVARYANDARPFSSPSEVNSQVDNFVTGGKQWGLSFEWPALFATKKIFPGQEITSSYGQLYWEIWAPKLKKVKSGVISLKRAA